MSATTIERIENIAPAASRRRNQGLTVVGALVVAAAAWVVTAGLTGAGLGSVAVALIYAAAAIGSVLLWALLASLPRLTRYSGIASAVIAVVLTGATLIGPITGAMAWGTASTLIVMNVALGRVAVTAFRRAFG